MQRNYWNGAKFGTAVTFPSFIGNDTWRIAEPLKMELLAWTHLHTCWSPAVTIELGFPMSVITWASVIPTVTLRALSHSNDVPALAQAANAQGEQERNYSFHLGGL